MNHLSPVKLLFFSCLLLGLWLLPADRLAAMQYNEDVSSQDYLFVKGMVRSVSSKNQAITLEQKKGPDIVVTVNPETELVGVGKYEELQVRQVIKVWYRPGQGGNSALKIIKLPDLGC